MTDFAKFQEGQWRQREEILSAGVPLVAVEVLWESEGYDTFLAAFPATSRLSHALDFHLREYCVRHRNEDGVTYDYSLVQGLSPRAYEFPSGRRLFWMGEVWLDAPLAEVAIYLAAQKGGMRRCPYYGDSPLVELALRYPAASAEADSLIGAP
jgi:hypothetical protein